MTSAAATRVFVSYAHRDGTELAQSLQRDLTDGGLDVWLDTRRIAGGATWTTEIEQALDNSEVVLALLTSGSYISDICRAEQLRALRKGKCVIPLVAQQGTDIPLYLEAKHYRDFTHSDSYSAQLHTLFQDILRREGRVLLKDQFRYTYVTVPPLPRNYVERPDAVTSLRQVLITDGGGSSIALTALEGMGGVGKTVLAQALCRDQVVQEAFPDGIAWVTVGKEAAFDIVTKMREVAKALNDNLGKYDTNEGCINQYRNTVRSKAALIIVDDVWKVSDIEPFLAESPRSRLLFTTRNSSIAAAVGAREHISSLLTEVQAREVLARWSGKESNDLPPEAGELIQECGRLPLAVSMVGAVLRGKPITYAKYVLNLLRTADLARIRVQFPGYPHADLLRAIQVSVEVLEPKVRDCYFALAVLLEDMPIHPEIQQVLWKANALDAIDTAETLVGLSLAQRDGKESIRLHDLQLDYIRAQYPSSKTLGLIHDALRLSFHVIDSDPGQFVSQMTARLLPHQNEPSIRDFSRDLISGSHRPWLRLIHPTLSPPGTGLVRTLQGHLSAVSAVATYPNGGRAISGSWDNTLKVWDLELGRELRTLQGHSNRVTAVAVCCDGCRAVSTSEDQTLKVWDLQAGRELKTLEGHSDIVTAVAVCQDGRRAVSASYDQTLRV